jgi:outer membrane immunogenic protein
MRHFMKLASVFTVVAALAAATFAAQAADLRTPNYKAPAYSPAYFSWTGFYVGLNGGYGFGKSTVSNNVGSTDSFAVKGAQVGGTIGYNLQTGSWVWGLEGDLDYSAMKGSSSTFCIIPCTVSNTWMGTARGRIGYAGWDRWLPYITAGLAAGNVKFEQGAFTDSRTKFGWTAGLGLEYAFLASWSAKIEYLYVDLGNAVCPTGTCNPTSDVTTKFNANLVRVGLNYRF